MQSMKETLILGNHPNTLVLAPHVLRLLSAQDAVLLTIPVIAALLPIIPKKNYQVLPITQYQRGSTRINDVFLNAFLAMYARFREVPYSQNPISDAATLLAKGRNLVLFPAGRVQKDLRKPERWKSGAGRILREAYPQNNNIAIALLRVFNRKTAELSESFPIQSLDIIPQATDNSYADIVEITHNLWLFYHTYFGVETN